MKMPKLENLGMREKIMISLMGVALAGMLMSIIAWWFLSGLEGMKSDREPLERRVRDARKLILSEEAVKADYLKIESMLGVSLSDAEAISDMKEDIENMARGAGLVCDPPSHMEPVADYSLPWREYTVQLAKCEGTMDALLGFISSIESSTFVYRVEKMSLAPAKTGTGISSSIVVSRIMLPPREEPAATADEM
jgi:hypothetical protein